MSIFSKVFSPGVQGAIDSVGNVIDKLTVNDEEKLTAKEKIANIVLASQFKLMDAQASVLKTELQGNWWQKSWRPICMIALIASLLIRYLGIVQFPIDKEIEMLIIELIKYGFSGYIASRGIEKTAKILTNNVDISMLKKRDRKQYYKIEGNEL